ncbi:hypothetical protein Slin14017_G067110 [Septoria linicola]|nr:hypothetical protein Slin14017_G067110 [Septoria linicola]
MSASGEGGVVLGHHRHSHSLTLPCHYLYRQRHIRRLSQQQQYQQGHSQGGDERKQDEEEKHPDILHSMSSEKCNEILGRKTSTSSAFSSSSGRATSVYIPAPSPLSSYQSSTTTSSSENEKPIFFINSYSPHPRYRRDSMDFRISEKKPSPPVSAGVNNVPAIPARGGPKARPFFKTYDACKFRSVRSSFYVRVGNPDEIPPERWPQVTWGWRENEYIFEYEGRRFCWRSTVTGLMSYLKDRGDYQLVDMENGVVLAAYVKDREWFAFKPIARIDFFVELGQGLELMALTAIMGIEERRRRKASAATSGSA